MGQQIITVAAATETELNESPFLVANPSRLTPSANDQVVYGVNLAGRDARLGTYQRWEGDGTKKTWTAAEVANLVNAHVDGGALAAADSLRVVVKINGVVQHRLAASGTLASGQFKTSTVGAVNQIDLFAAPAAGAKVEIFLAPAAGTVNAPAQITPATSTALMRYEVPATQVVYAAATFQIDRLTR